MICPRHHLIARFEEHGRAYCGKCFTEAALFAREMTLETNIRRLQGRLRGKR